MTRYFLTRVQIEGFRGINNEAEPLDLRFRKDAVNSVFAANSLGKSSVYEALCYAIRGVVPKLEALHANEKPGEYYCNRFHSSGTAEIVLTLTPDDGTTEVVARIQRSAIGKRTVDSPSGHPDPQSILRSLDTELALLDHKTFLQFIDDAPLKRGRAFSGLLGLGKLSELRQALEVLSNQRNLKTDFHLDTLTTQVANARQRAAHALRTVRSSYQHLMGADLPATIQHAAIVEEVSEALGKVPLLKPFFESADLGSIEFKDVRTAIKKTEASDKRDRLAAVIRSITKLQTLAPGSSEKNEQEELRKCIRERDEALALTRGPLFQELYNTLTRVLDSDEWDDPSCCPACESEALSPPLCDTVASHLEQYERVRTSQTAILLAWNKANWVSRLRSLEALNELGIPEKDRRASALDDLFRHKQPSEDDVNDAVDVLNLLDERRDSTLAQCQKEKNNLEAELPPSLVDLTEQVEHAEELKDAIAEHQTHESDSKATASKLTQRQHWATFIEYAAKSFANAEVALSTSQTNAIETEYRRLYETITNNPEVVPTLRKATGSEELHLRLEDFYGLEDLSAAALLPESYRNALALSIFLAAVLKTQTSARFMVLDDITSSFDAGLQYSLMEVLRSRVAYPANPDGPQVIVLSHDGLLEKYFDSLSNATGWHHQRLQGLPPRGLVLSQAQDSSRLRANAEKYLRAGQVEQAFPLIRQYLEYRLLQVIRKVGIRVPLDFSIRDDRKMVGNCLKAINDAVDLHEKAGSLILSPEQLKNLHTVHAPALISNWVNHYSTAVTGSLSPYPLLGVLDAVDQFVECFMYTSRDGASSSQRFYASLAGK